MSIFVPRGQYIKIDFWAVTAFRGEFDNGYAALTLTATIELFCETFISTANERFSLGQEMFIKL